MDFVVVVNHFAIGGYEGERYEGEELALAGDC
jgi:hypothetical protein